MQYDLFCTVQAANSIITQISIENHLEYHSEKLSSLWNFENWDKKWRMCSRNQFLFHLLYTTDEGNYKLWKIRHTEKQTSSFLSKRISNKFFQNLQSSPPASTRSLQLSFVIIGNDIKSFCLRDRGRLANEGQPILLKFGTQSCYVDLCTMPKS